MGVGVWEEGEDSAVEEGHPRHLHQHIDAEVHAEDDAEDDLGDGGDVHLERYDSDSIYDAGQQLVGCRRESFFASGVDGGAFTLFPAQLPVHRI